MGIETNWYQELSAEKRFYWKKVMGALPPDQMSTPARELVAWLMTIGGAEIRNGLEALVEDVRRHYQPAAGRSTCSCGAHPCPYIHKASKNSSGWRGPDGLIHRV